jgi:dienelactone hydrolase
MGYGHTVDAVVGQLTRLLHVRPTTTNTTDDFEKHYLDIPIEELFPRPFQMPTIKRNRPLLSGIRMTETLTWKSSHLTLSRAYRRRHENEYAPNLTAHARWMHPRFGRRRSLLIYVHGWLEPGSWVEENTLMPRWYKDLGVDVAYLQLPFHGWRSPRGQLFPGEWFWTADLVRSIESVRQAMCDLRTVLSYFRDMGYEEVGVTGLSLGGSIAMLSACLDPTPDYVVPLIAHLELREALEDAPILWRMKTDLERFGVDATRRKSLFDRLAITDVRPILAADRQLWVAGREDGYLKADLVERQWERWGRPPIEWLVGGHMTFALELEGILARMKTMPRAAKL